jgi:hypothetical protein
MASVSIDPRENGVSKDTQKVLSFQGQGSGPKKWQGWWDGLSDADRVNVNLAIANNYESLTGKTIANLDSWKHMNLVENLFANMQEGKLNTQGDLDRAISAYVKDGSFKEDYTRYQTAFNRFKSSVQKQDFMYDKAAWTDEKLEQEFRNNYTSQGAGEDASYTATAIQDTIAVLNNDFTKKVESGTLDSKGNPVVPGATAGKLDGIASGLGLTGDYALSSAAKEYYDKQLRENKMQPYEVEQALKGTDEYIKARTNQIYTQYADQLDPILKKDLENIGIISEKSKVSAQQAFADMAPEVTRQASKLGGRDRAYTTQALAGAAGEIEQKRQTYTTGLEAAAYDKDSARRAQLALGQVGTEFGQLSSTGANGAGIFANTTAGNLKSLSALNGLNESKSALLVQRQNERYNREVQKENERMLKAQQDALRKANSKAGKFGIFANTLSGMATGLMATGGNPLGAVAGAGVGFASGWANNKNVQNQNLSAVPTVTSYSTAAPDMTGLYNQLNNTSWSLWGKQE